MRTLNCRVVLDNMFKWLAVHFMTFEVLPGHVLFAKDNSRMHLTIDLLLTKEGMGTMRQVSLYYIICVNNIVKESVAGWMDVY
jgi:hypothetical protein